MKGIKMKNKMYDYNPKINNIGIEYSDNLNYNLIGNKKSSELKKKSTIAHMGEIVFSTPDKPIVGTVALATCNGIIFYDKKNKKAWVGHGPASSSIYTLITMFEIIKREVTGELEYSIIPGWDNIHDHNFKEVDEMIAFLRSNCPKSIRLIPITNLYIRQDNRANPSYEFAFNAETGESVTNDLFYDEVFISTRKK